LRRLRARPQPFPGGKQWQGSADGAGGGDASVTIRHCFIEFCRAFAQAWRIDLSRPELSFHVRGTKAMLLIVLILFALLLFGGGGFYGRRTGWGPRGFGGLLVLILVVILLIWFVNELIMPPLPMPAGTPSIIR
jgi:hypothetical protein